LARKSGAALSPLRIAQVWFGGISTVSKYLTARCVVDPSLTRISAEQAMKTIVRHDGELLFRGELPNCGVVREFFEACPCENLDQFDRCRRGSASRHRTKGDDRCQRDEAKTR
jgi:hypothetical protein